MSIFPGWKTTDWQKSPEIKNQNMAEHQNSLPRVERAGKDK